MLTAISKSVYSKTDSYQLWVPPMRPTLLHLDPWGDGPGEADEEKKDEAEMQVVSWNWLEALVRGMS